MCHHFWGRGVESWIKKSPHSKEHTQVRYHFNIQKMEAPLLIHMDNMDFVHPGVDDEKPKRLNDLNTSMPQN